MSLTPSIRRAQSTVPTAGFNSETLDRQSMAGPRRGSYLVFDVSGSVSGDGDEANNVIQSRRRTEWRLHLFRGEKALVFVMDASEPDQVAQARDELAWLLAQEELRTSVVLVLANKQDLPGALTSDALSERATLETLLQGRRWGCLGVSAQSGDGVHAVVEWLETNLH